jgi:hypothetical protein
LLAAWNLQAYSEDAQSASLFDHARRVNIDHHPELGEADPYFGFGSKQTFLKALEAWLKRTL